MKEGSESRFQEFSLELKRLKGLIEGLENQFSAVASQMSGIQQSVAVAQQQAAHALAGANGSDMPPPAPIMNSGPDLETIRALSELKNKLNSLCDKVNVIENNENSGKISQEDLELMKASLLEEIPNYIENSLENIRAQLAALEDKNNKLNEIVDLRMKKDEGTPTEKLTRPRSAASRSDLEKLASKAQVEKIQQTLEKSTSRLDDRISSEILSLHDKIKGSSGGMWDDLEKLKAQFGSFTEDLGNLRTNMIQKMSELEGMSGGEIIGNNSLLSVDTLSPALTKLIDRLQKKQWNLEESLAEITGALANLDEEGRNRSENIRVLFASVEKLENTKADKSEIVKLQCVFEKNENL